MGGKILNQFIQKIRSGNNYKYHHLKSQNSIRFIKVLDASKTVVKSKFIALLRQNERKLDNNSNQESR